MTVSITVEELLDALRDATTQAATPIGDAGLFTGTDIRKATGWCAARFTREMTALKEAGLLRTTRVKREAIDGRLMSVVAYEILRPTHIKKKS